MTDGFDITVTEFERIQPPHSGEPNVPTTELVCIVGFKVQDLVSGNSRQFKAFLRAPSVQYNHPVSYLVTRGYRAISYHIQSYIETCKQQPESVCNLTDADVIGKKLGSWNEKTMTFELH